MVTLDDQEVQPEQIMERRLVQRGNKAVLQVLVKWTNIPITSATWEDFYVIKNRFQMLFIGDKQVV